MLTGLFYIHPLFLYNDNNCWHGTFWLFFQGDQGNIGPRVSCFCQGEARCFWIICSFEAVFFFVFFYWLTWLTKTFLFIVFRSLADLLKTQASILNHPSRFCPPSLVLFFSGLNLAPVPFKGQKTQLLWVILFEILKRNIWDLWKKNISSFLFFYTHWSNRKLKLQASSARLS